MRDLVAGARGGQGSFLRSRTSLIQRSAARTRHIDGRALLYTPTA